MQFEHADTLGGLDVGQLFEELTAAGIAVEVVAELEPPAQGGPSPGFTVTRKRLAWTANMEATIRDVVEQHRPRTREQREARQVAKMRERLGL